MLSDLLASKSTDDKGEFTKLDIQLWEDVLPELSTKLDEAVNKTKYYGALGKELDILFNGDLYGFLLYSGVPPHLTYPIMRLNGYKSYAEYSSGDDIKVLELSELSQRYESQRIKRILD